MSRQLAAVHMSMMATPPPGGTNEMTRLAHLQDEMRKTDFSDGLVCTPECQRHATGNDSDMQQ